MLLSWFKNQRRKKLLQEPFPDAWVDYLHANVRYYPLITAAKRAQVQSFIRVFVAEKNWYGGGKLAITDEMKVTVAGQLAIMILGLQEPYYFDQMQSIVIHPSAFRNAPKKYDPVFGGRKVLMGQAWRPSPILLSWRDVLRCGRNESNGSNVVVHEFTHHLDGLDGEVDGTPSFHGQKRLEWHRVAEAEYRRLVGNARRNEATLLDHYGASNLVEFFAVATECFFEQPRAMSLEHRELYSLLSDYYEQDPAAWLPDAKTDAAQVEEKKTANRAENLAPFDPAEWMTANADELFTMMVILLNEGRYRNAEWAASRAIELAPNDAEIHQHRGMVRVKLGKFAEAIQDCDQALEIDPENLDARRWRAAALIGLNRYEQAQHELEETFEFFREDADSYYLRGLVWSALGEDKRAVADFSKSIRLHPFNVDALYHRSQAYERLGQYEDAESDRQEAFDLDPQADHPTWQRKNCEL